MLKSELLEREAEARRLELSETFEELRSRATPGHVLDQIVDYASTSGGVDLFRNLRDQSVANPLALGLVGAGLAWLMLSSREPRRSYDPYAYDEMRPPRGRMRSYLTATRERAGNAVSGARHLMSDTAQGVGGIAQGVRERAAGAAHVASDAAHMASDLASDLASNTAGSIASTARSARDAALGTASSIGETASSVGGQARSRAGGAASTLYGGASHTAGRTASGVRALASGTASTGRDALDFARDQPLVLAGLGLAFGAAIGAAFRSTETERQFMGETSDDLRERTYSFAAENYQKSRSVASSIAEAVYDEFQNRNPEDRATENREAGSPQSGPQSGQAAAGTGQTSIVPVEEEIAEIQETLRPPERPERIGLRDRDRRG